MIFLTAFAAAEILAAFVDVRLGALAHAVVALAALNAYLTRKEPEPVLAIAGLLSITRLVAMAMPLRSVPLGVRMLAVGAPALIAALLLMRHLRDRRATTSKPEPRAWWPHAVAAGVGIPLGLAAAAAQDLDRLPTFSSTVLGYVLTAAALVLFAAATEEILFRRLLVPSLRARLGTGPAPLLVGAAVFACTYLGSHSVLLVALAAAAGLLFSWVVDRSGSIVGPLIGHALVNVGAFLVWPALLAR